MKLNCFLYLLADANALADLLPDVNLIERRLAEISDVVRFLSHDKDVEMFYDSNDVKQATTAINDVMDEPERLTNPISALRILLKSVRDTRHDVRTDPQSSYFSWRFDTTGIHPENGSLLAEVAERILADDGANRFLILALTDTLHSDAPIIPVLKDKLRDENLPKFLRIRYATSLAQAYTWLNANRTQRRFNWNPKHGEKGIGMRPNKIEKVSPLLCSREEAHEMLQTAIGYKGANEVYTFDHVHSRYIVFKFEIENQETYYHGYHPEDETEVPADARKWIGRLYGTDAVDF